MLILPSTRILFKNETKNHDYVIQNRNKVPFFRILTYNNSMIVLGVSSDLLSLSYFARSSSYTAGTGQEDDGIPDSAIPAYQHTSTVPVYR